MFRSIFSPLPEREREICDELERYASARIIDEADSRIVDEWKGYRFPVPFSGEAAKNLYENHEFCDDSVIIATFGKAGTTWTTEIVRQILYGRDKQLDEISKIATTKILCYLEMWKAKKMDLLKFLPLQRKIHATHLSQELINFEKVKKSKSKIILTIRNPKDQVVSWFHFVQSPHFDDMRDCYSTDWSQFFDEYMQGKHPIPVTKPGETYAEYLLDWYKRKNDENVLLVYFERLKKNPKAEIQRIGEFMNVDLTEEELNDVTKKTTFQNMKENLEKGDGVAARFLKGTNLMRKGEIGSWKDIMTVAQSEAMDEMIKKKLGHTDLEFIYE